MKRLTNSTIAVLKAMQTGGQIRYDLEKHPTLLWKTVRKLTFKGSIPDWKYADALLNKAFDILAAKGFIIKTSDDRTARVYVATPKGAEYLKAIGAQ